MNKQQAKATATATATAIMKRVSSSSLGNDARAPQSKCFVVDDVAVSVVAVAVVVAAVVVAVLPARPVKYVSLKNKF